MGSARPRWASPTALSLIAANLLPLYGVLLLGWAVLPIEASLKTAHAGQTCNCHCQGTLQTPPGHQSAVGRRAADLLIEALHMVCTLLL